MPHATTTLQEYLSPKQAASYLGIGYSTFLRDYIGFIKNYNLEVSRLSAKVIRIKRSSLDRLMQALQVEV